MNCVTQNHQVDPHPLDVSPVQKPQGHEDKPGHHGSLETDQDHLKNVTANVFPHLEELNMDRRQQPGAVYSQAQGRADENNHTEAQEEGFNY